MQVTARVRRVGNSLSIVIPAERARAEKIAEGDVVQVEIQKKVNIQDLYGSLKSRKSSQTAKDEARSGWKNVSEAPA
jgi:antitoxin component of MazEF toxin-antitoxin module